MQLFIGSDHAAFEMKKLIIDHIRKQKYEIEDLGTYSEESCDYPDIALAVGQKVVETPNSRGILICASGVGISIMANKVKGVRCGLAIDYHSASKASKFCNIIAFGSRVIGPEIAKQIVDTFLIQSQNQENIYDIL